MAASQTATFTCVSAGEPPPSVAWTLNGVLLDPASGQVTVQTSGPTSVLLVPDAQSEDEGSYRCVASNAEGEAASSAAELQLACKQKLWPLSFVSEYFFDK